MVACDANQVFENYYSTPSSGWNKDTIVAFNVDIKANNDNYNILMNCRNLENYPYSNLWLFVDIISPDGTTATDTLEYQLALPNGKWTGKGTSGVYYNQFNFRKNIYFPVAGSYTFRIQHGMRDDNLKGLKDIGLRLEKVE